MPNWKTHLEISNKINKLYGFEGLDLKKFLFGSILPDINNAHVVEKVSVEIPNEITHFYKKDMPSYLIFYEKYKEQIDAKNPLFVGYVTHLYTDYTWNNAFYTKIDKDNYPETDRNTLRKMKWNDFAIFNNQFIENVIDVFRDEEIENIFKECQIIEEIHVSKEDVNSAVNFLMRKEIYQGDMKFFSIEELEILLDETVKRLS